MTHEEMEQLVKTCHYSAHEWFHNAIKTIDDKFGDGYAKKHPELIAAMVSACAVDYQASVASQDYQHSFFNSPSPPYRVRK